MAWIPDVHPNELIEAAYGNTLRDHVVNTFASAAERDAAIPAPAEGMATFITGTGMFEVRRGGFWRPPAGSIVYSNGARLPDIATTTTGVYDLVMLGAAVTFPYPTSAIATVAATGGAGASFANFSFDIARLLDGLVVSTGSPIQAIASAWSAAAVTSAYGVGAGQVVGFKARTTFVQGTGGYHTTGDATLVVYAV